MSVSRWVPWAVGTALHFGGTSLFAQKIPAVAFLSDIHLQDVYAPLTSPTFQGVRDPKTGKFATIRTMESQLHSTRLFNENYFALLQALEDLARQKIKWVVLPGDFTDDGQPMNVKALREILEQYETKHGMRFFITTGNHDPASPFGRVAGKIDFLGTSGQNQPLAGSALVFPRLEAAITDQINHWGYDEICQELANFGFFPSKKDLFWTHPFEALDYENYSWTNSSSHSTLAQRSYLVPGTRIEVPDASYLVEPVEGLWLLALDGNTYTSQQKESPQPEEWGNTSTGFNLTSQVKGYQLEWIKKVTEEAEKRGKLLVSFSHYPLVDYHSGATESMAALFGKGKFQLNRAPSPTASELYARAGLSLHFAGHMHFNGTGIHTTKEGKTLVNIQVPSLAAFPPAYKILEKTESGKLHVETEILEEVQQMDAFFDLYRMENRWLAQTRPDAVWNEAILETPSYVSYTQIHLHELIRLRFLKTDWPEELGSIVNTITLAELETWAALNEEEGQKYLALVLSKAVGIFSPSYTVGYLMEDFYLVKNGGDLGKSLLGTDRLDLYSRVIDLKKGGLENSNSLHGQLGSFIRIFSLLLAGLPSDDFWIDLPTGEITKDN